MTTLTFIGSGSAFDATMENYHSNMLVTVGEQHLLIDCGSDARYALAELSIPLQSIDAFYVSHLHGDHVGGLEWAGFMNRFVFENRPHLFANKQLVEPLWDNVLSGGMKCIEQQNATLQTFFEVHAISGMGFEWQGLGFELVPVQHTQHDHQDNPSFGLLIAGGDSVIFITTDTQYTPAYLMPFYQQADLIFQDCETGTVNSGVHARYEQLSALPEDIKAKMWLYHFSGQPKEQPLDDGFLGFVQKGQVFEF